MTARAGIAYIITEVRRLSGAGTAAFTVDNASFFSDDAIERILDSRRARLARSQISFEPELSESGGTTVYKNARIGFGWLEDEAAGSGNDFKVTDGTGIVIGTVEYTLSAEDGFLTFASDQHGSIRYVTGWVHNPYKAAYDVLMAWSMQLARQADWSTDNMAVKRSQKAKELREQMRWLKELAGLAPRIVVAKMERSDIYVEELVKPSIIYDKIQSE